MTKSRSRAAVLAGACTVAVCGIGASLPIWTIRGRYTAEERAQGMTKPFTETIPFWAAPADIALDTKYRWQNAIYALTLIVVASGLGLYVFRVARPSEPADSVRDFAEGLGGSVPDGRADSSQPSQ